MKTVIRRPATKERRNWGGRSVWTEVARRPCRPMNNVVLDEDVKFKVMLNINEYLDPCTARWYAIRGTPYRGGYLLHEPPGTAKTSLTFALAGVFGSNIYVVSLLEPTHMEQELENLFTHLPPRCIVLLEDIDTTGLARLENKDETPDESSDEDNDPPVDEKQDLVAILTQVLLKSSKANKHGKGGKEEDDEKKGISLSGLLNIIDGVASHEGRVLVMTINHPEKLDEALIRPGRIDLHVAFTNATRYQVQEIFKRMYSNDPQRETIPVLHKPQNSAPHPPKAPEVKKPAVIVEKNEKVFSDKRSLTPPDTLLTAQSENGAETETEKGTRVLCSRTPELAGKHMTKLGEVRDVLQPGELELMAREFSEHVEDQMFSPAEIQGFC
ncbi:mitochondrial chaperone BCS1 protein [Rutstroemia sp. NJR-2017a BBW]|nr:mitochondrial chaperone BCS1 protein [Rutstroemia sp. NJR-2017a BBW]